MRRAWWNRYIIGAGFVTLALGACTKNAFRAPSNAATSSGGGNGNPTELPKPIPAQSRVASEVKPLLPNQENHIWIATSVGEVRHLKLEKGLVKQTKAWSGASPTSGTRTYVLEGGAVVLAKNGGYYYFLHDGLSEGAIDKDPAKGNYFQLITSDPTKQPKVDDRSCVVSYKKDGKRYLGIGYGLGYFFQVEQEDKPPYAPNFKTATVPIQVAPVNWGYSCFIDQTRLIYYSQYARGLPSETIALDLTSMQRVPVSKAPNAAFVSQNVPAVTVGPYGAQGKGSYAMAGDRLGNVLNATGYTTMAFEPKTATVWASADSGTRLDVFPHDCIYKTPECKGQGSFELGLGMRTGVGPLSALGDGSMVGLVRQFGDVFLFKLKDPTDISKGIEATKIAEAVGNGDPYMYTDFTGATLYLSNSLNDYDFSKTADWSTRDPLQQLSLMWEASPGSSDEWKDIRAEIRCYLDEGNKGEFTEVNIIAKSKVPQLIDITSCKGKAVAKAELRLTQIGASTSLGNITKVELKAYQ